MKVQTALLTAAITLGLCVPASAGALPWEKGQGDSTARAEKMAKRIKAKRAELIRTRIGLSEEQSEQVLTTLERFDPRRRELMEKKRGLGEAMDRLFSSDSADEAEYRKVLAGLLAMEDAFHQLRSEQATAIGQVVGPRFQLRILVALKRLQRRLHKRQHDRRRGGAEKHRGQGREGQQDGPRRRRRGGR